jgi:hypothetical protein
VTRRKIILIVGPSGVGKTSAYQSIEGKFSNCVAQHLDGLASDWAVELGWLLDPNVDLLRNHINKGNNDDQLFLAFGLESIGMLASRHPEKHLIIDVGAGFQDARSAENLHRIHDVISITAEPSIAYSRICKRPNEKRSFKDYKAQEFSEHRIKVYKQAQYSIDTTSRSPQDTAVELANRLQLLVCAS